MLMTIFKCLSLLLFPIPGFFSRITDRLSSVLLNVLKRVYIIVSTILLWDTWLLICRTAITRDARRRRLLLLLLFVLPLLLLGGKSPFKNILSPFLINRINSHRRYFLSNIDCGISFPLVQIFSWEDFCWLWFRKITWLCQDSVRPGSGLKNRSRNR